MVGLACVSDSFIHVLLGGKWTPAIKILQILCFAQIWDHLCIINLNLLYVKGKTNLVLKLEVVKKMIAVVILISTLSYGLYIMCLGRILYGIISFYINTIYTKQIIDISFKKQIIDIGPSLLISIALGLFVNYVLIKIDEPNIIELIIGLLMYYVIYTIIIFSFFSEIRIQIISFLQKNINKFH